MFDELLDRVSEWLGDAEDRVNDRVPGAEEIMDPDWCDNKNRKYKAPLSVHSKATAMVTDDSESPSIG